MINSVPLPRPIHLGEFTPLVGHALMADCDPQPVALQLVEASPLINHAKLDRPPFILIFRSAPDAMLMPGSYVLRGGGFGPDLIDIGRIARPLAGEPGHYYQAVFN
ncbi:hypothetical protein [Sphingomonas sp. UV9]|uniref:DUF6916 family protein n=1 Tax=Sphingomonas sp. UV9 TaxID=1851410 RepID=UPI001F0CCC02|nr:hypothetical protein [Sphingomonas sp. UV9]